MTKRGGDSTKVIFTFLFALLALIAIVDIIDTYNTPESTVVKLTIEEMVQQEPPESRDRSSFLKSRSTLANLIENAEKYDLPERVVSLKKQFLLRQNTRGPEAPQKRPIDLQPKNPLSSCLNRGNGEVPLDPNHKTACLRNMAKARIPYP